MLHIDQEPATNSAIDVWFDQQLLRQILPTHLKWDPGKFAHDCKPDHVGGRGLSNKVDAFRLVWGKIKKYCPHIETMEFSDEELKMIADTLLNLVEDREKGKPGYCGPVESFTGTWDFAPHKEGASERLMAVLGERNLLPLVNFINNKWIMGNMSPASTSPESGAMSGTRDRLASTLE